MKGAAGVPEDRTGNDSRSNLTRPAEHERVAREADAIAVTSAGGCPTTPLRERLAIVGAAARHTCQVDAEMFAVVDAIVSALLADGMIVPALARELWATYTDKGDA